MSFRILTGPLLRHTDTTSATVWVETNAPCTVQVTAADASAEADTFQVHGHHYAIVTVEGLSPGTTTPYTLLCNNENVWPDEATPQPVLRTLSENHDESLRFLWGSCRVARGEDMFGADMLRLGAEYTLQQSPEQRPSHLLLVGDQVYADHPPAPVYARMSEQAREKDQLLTFEEYSHGYQHSFGPENTPALRWLLASTSTLMIFDDHDVCDDWNTSHHWITEMNSTPWWPTKLRAALAAYWVYQHLGNLSPAEREKDPVWSELQTRENAEPGCDHAEWMEEFWETFRHDTSVYRFSHAHNLGNTRLIMLDVRAGRQLSPEKRAIWDDNTREWFHEQLTDGGFTHYFIASSLPALLPRAVHHAEGWNEKLSNGAWGQWLAEPSEKLRQSIDLEHWPAFRDSLCEITEWVDELAHKHSPATIQFLGGDVHFSYSARAESDTHTRISQLVSSPFQHPLSTMLRTANRIAVWPLVTLPAAAAAQITHVRSLPWTWKIEDGPIFENTAALTTLEGGTSVTQWLSNVENTDTVREVMVYAEEPS